MSKKILIFSHEFPPDTGGAGVVAFQYAIEFVNRGYNVDVLTRYKNEDKRFDRFNIYYNMTNSKFWFLGYRNIVDYNDYDIIFLNDPSSTYVAGLFFTKEQLKKSICFLHGSEPEQIYEKTTLFRKLSFFKYFYNRAITSSKQIISPSIYMKEKFLNGSNLVELKKNINVIYYGVDSSLFIKKTDNNIKLSLGIRDNQEVLISVSRITKQKGYLRKYKLFKNLVNIYKKDLVWIIIGDGIYFENLKKMIINDGLENRIFLLGKVSREELYYYYYASNLFWLLSEYKESFGLVYIEAQLCGLPVLANDLGGVKEAIKDEKTGYLIKSNDQVVNIINSLKYKKLNINNIKNFALMFDIKKSIAKLERCIFDVK